MTDQGTFYSGADPSFPSERQVTDWAENNDHADGTVQENDEPDRMPVITVNRTWGFRITAEPGTWPDMPTHAGARDVIRPDTLVVKVSAADGAAAEIAEWVAAGASLYPDGRASPHRDRSCDYYTHDSVPDWVTAALGECLAAAGVPVADERMAAATGFVEAWAGIFGDGAVSMTCIEAETAADLLKAFGRAEAAEHMMTEHAETDRPGDTHYPERGLSD